MRSYINITIALPLEVAEKLNKVAYETHRTKRSMVIQAIEQYIKQLNLESMKAPHDN